MNTEHLGIQEFFRLLSRDRIDLVDQFYDQNIHFVDPMVNFKDREDLKKYYDKLYKNVESIRFDFSAEVKNDDVHVAVWTMTVIAKKFNGGKPVIVDGVSHIRFGGQEGKAIYHRDYFDMGVFVYENIPVLSTMIRFVKRVMSGQH